MSGIKDQNHQTYWVSEDPRRILHLGAAVEDFFDRVLYGDNSNVMGIGRDIAAEYRLDEPQIDFMKDIILRTHRAREIVKYLEQRFGGSEGMFDDPHGLHKLMTPKKTYQPKFLSARSYGVAIGFKKDRWVRKDWVGYAPNSWYEILMNDVAKSIRKFEAGKSTSVRTLSFFTSLDLIPPSEVEEVYCEFTPGPLSIFVNQKTRTAMHINHEVRHVLDNIIGYDNISTPHYAESQADMMKLDLDGFERDKASSEKITQHKIDDCEAAIQRKEIEITQAGHSESNAMGLRSEHVSRLRRELTDKIEERSALQETLKSETEEIDNAKKSVRSIPPRNWAAVSYLISMTPNSQVSTMLERVARQFN